MGSKSVTRTRTIPTSQYFLLNSLYDSYLTSAGCTESLVRTASNDPMYKSKIAKGQSATNPMTVTVNHYKIQQGAAKCVYRRAGQVGQISWMRNPGFPLLLGTSFSQPLYPSSLLADAKNLAAIGIRKKIQNETQTWSGLEFLGELRETIHGIRNPADALLKYAREFFFTRNGIKKKRRSKRALRKALAGSRLEFQFGVLPLLGDISAIATSALFASEEKRVKRLSYRGHAEDAFPRGVINYAACGITSINYDVFEKREAAFQYIVGIQKTTNVSSGLSAIVNSGGFVAENVISAGWELLPLSVFVDYFLNIGDVLSTTLVSMHDVVWTCSTSKESSCVTHGSGRLVATANIAEVVPSEAVVSRYRFKIVRTTDAVAIPQLRFSLPVKPSRLLNLAAFLTLIT